MINKEWKVAAFWTAQRRYCSVDFGQVYAVQLANDGPHGLNWRWAKRVRNGGCGKIDPKTVQNQTIRAD